MHIYNMLIKLARRSLSNLKSVKKAHEFTEQKPLVNTHTRKAQNNRFL